MSAFEAFATAFLNKTADQIDTRKQEGRDYFNKQMERAQTVGRGALQARRANLSQLTRTTNTLMTQANMPDEVVRALVNEGPEALAEAQKIYDTAASQGQTLDEEFWRGIVKFSGEVKPGNQSLSEFLSQSVGLFDSNLQATAPRGGDPFSAFVSAGLGYNAMDVARQKLDSEAVEGGYSASDLLAMESGPAMESPLGSLGTTIDQTQAALKLAPPANEATAAQKIAVDKAFTEKVTADRQQFGFQNGREPTEEEFTQIKQKAAQDIIDLAGPDLAGQVPSLREFLGITSTPLPPQGEEAPAPAVAPPSDLPQSGEVYQIDGEEAIATGEVDIDGDPIFSFPDGSKAAVVWGGRESVDEPVAPLPEAPVASPAPAAPVAQPAGTQSAVEQNEDPFITLAPGQEPPPTKVIDGKTLTYFGKTMVGNVNFITYQDEQGNRTSIPVKESR